ncbi:hypothetical protein BKG02_004758 [Vibrio parahaemolyticus]|uniref:hypothetical protein n=1 Tax=Vibrio parahaemolyticus TaxID=670 RepID=UPI0028076C18|nr:hypothetical protein [Vibrio parahaemolyticus]EJE4644405.1 hypothetical protein [Vibrio parahaemolyticus]ELA9292949.1 hypothetical protein [Vibrio parahaemolyticus]MDS1925690.1 hypothetical protein [Vibrio parahaemolyticus]
MSNQNRATILINDTADLRNFQSVAFYVEAAVITMPNQEPSSRIDHQVIGRRKPCDDAALSERLEVVAVFGCPNAAAIFASMARETAKHI